MENEGLSLDLSNLSQGIKDELLKAKMYAEGKVIQVNIVSMKEVENILKLISFKVN